MERWTEEKQSGLVRDFIRGLIDKPEFGPNDVIRIAQVANLFRTERLAGMMLDTQGRHVQSGPFKGMQLWPVQMGSMLMPRLLGTYESEIAHIFKDMSRFSRFVDIGSAEGYYAVGCPFAHPHLRTIAYDTGERARAVCARVAAMNGVADRIDQRGLCTPDELAGLATPDTLIFVDIDGAETELLCGTPADRLARSEIVVEVHQQGTSTTEVDIIPHFAATHDIQAIRQSIVDPWQFECLHQLTAFERYLAVWEGRKTEAWLHLKPRS